VQKGDRIMSIVYNYKAIKEECDKQSKAIMDYDKPRVDPGAVEVCFEADDELDQMLNKKLYADAAGAAPAPVPQQTTAKPWPSKSRGSLLKFACPRCGASCKQKPGYGWYCGDCDEFVA